MGGGRVWLEIKHFSILLALTHELVEPLAVGCQSSVHAKPMKFNFVPELLLEWTSSVSWFYVFKEYFVQLWKALTILESFQENLLDFFLVITSQR